MSKLQLEAAKEFMFNKQYKIARTILEALQHDETAKSWLTILNKNVPIPASSLSIPLPPFSIRETIDEKLCETIDQSESYAELFLRIRLIYEMGSSIKNNPIKNTLYNNLFSDNEKRIERSCYLLGIFKIDDTNVLDKLGSLFQAYNVDEKINWSAKEALFCMGYKGEIKLYETWVGMRVNEVNYEILDSHNPNKSLIDSSDPLAFYYSRAEGQRKVLPGLVVEYQVLKNDVYWFSVKILRTEKNTYEIISPEPDRLSDNVYPIKLINQMADERATVLNMIAESDARYQEDNNEGWQTYLHDLAPYEDDYEPPYSDDFDND